MYPNFLKWINNNNAMVNLKFLFKEGCPHSCNRHGSCVKINDDWQCKCEDDWSGTSCSVPLEKICDDKIDNDNGKLWPFCNILMIFAFGFLLRF